MHGWGPQQEFSHGGSFDSCIDIAGMLVIAGMCIIMRKGIAQVQKVSTLKRLGALEASAAPVWRAAALRGSPWLLSLATAKG